VGPDQGSIERHQAWGHVRAGRHRLHRRSGALALTVFDAAHSEFEERWFTLGISSAGKLLAVSHTYAVTEPGRTKLRIISAREGTRNERRQYEDDPR